MSPKYHAKALLKKLDKLALPVDLYKLAKINNINIKEISSEGFEGILITANDSAIIGVNQNIRHTGRKRFTIAHELGHFHMHFSQGDRSCTVENINSYDNKDGIEYEANEFAAEILMPEDLFYNRIKMVDLSYPLLQSLSSEYDTTLTSTGIRYVELSKDHALIYSKGGKVEWFCKGEDFPYFISHGKLHEESYAFDFHKGENHEKVFHHVPAYAWLDDDRLDNDFEIKELSIPLQSYNSILSFIYVDYDETEDGLDELDGDLRFRK